MPTIRDLVGALRRRDGVEAAILLGRDGLLIDGESTAAIDRESAAALIPSIVSAADEFGLHDGPGALTMAVLEYDRGVAFISVLTSDTILLVLARADANAGALLYELRRHRAHIASLV